LDSDEEDEITEASTVENNSPPARSLRPDFIYNGDETFQQQSLAGQHYIAKSLDKLLENSCVKDTGEQIYKKHQHFIQHALVTSVMDTVRVNLDPVFTLPCNEYQERTLRKLVVKVGALDEDQINQLKKRISEMMATYRNFIRTIAVNALIQMPVKETQIKAGMYTPEGKMIKDPAEYQPIIEAPSIGRVLINMLKESIRFDIRRYKWEEVFVSLLASSILECYGALKAKKPQECSTWFFDVGRVNKVCEAWQKREDKEKLRARRMEWLREHEDQANGVDE